MPPESPDVAVSQRAKLCFLPALRAGRFAILRPSNILILLTAEWARGLRHSSVQTIAKLEAAAARIWAFILDRTMTHSLLSIGSTVFLDISRMFRLLSRTTVLRGVILIGISVTLANLRAAIGGFAAPVGK